MKEDVESIEIWRIMKKNVVCLDKGRTVLDAATEMINKGIGCIVITDKEKPLGIITERDILCEIAVLGRSFAKLRLGIIASRPLVHVPPEKTVAESADLMMENNIRRLVVIKNGDLAGIVTIRDITEFLLRTKKSLTKKYLKLYQKHSKK